MTLKEKFEKEILTGDELFFISSQCEIIADEFAIGFAEWLLWQDITQRGKCNFVCADGVQRNTKELLQIYKKEKGL